MTELASVTTQETVLLSEFIKLLEQEQDVLKRADVAALPGIGQQKVELVDKLNALESARSKILPRQSGETEKAAMTRWLANKPSDQVAAANWKKLMELARRAKQLHEFNAQLINLHLQQTGELLSILTQQSQKTPLYGSDGQAASSTGSRIVDSA